MKIKLILAVFILLNLINLTNLYSQTDLTIKIVNSSGVPINGLTSTDIKFIKSPFTGTEVVAGLTITEENGNTLGTYHVSGFTTFQLVELWISGTKYKDFGRKYTGDITNQDLFVINHPYINTGSPLYSNYSDGQFFLSTLVWRGYVEALYGRLGVNNTWSANQVFNGSVTFNGTVSGLTGIPSLTGTNTWSGANIFNTNPTTFYEPLLSGSSPWGSDYSTFSTGSILSKTINDSLYNTKTSGFVFTKLRRFPQNFANPLFDVKATQFYFDNTTGQLTLMPQFVDSMALTDMTIHKDTSDSFGNTLSMQYNFQRLKDVYVGADSVQGLVVDYSRNTNGSVISSDEFHLINTSDVIVDFEGDEPLNNSTFTVLNHATTFTIPFIAVWRFDVEFQYEFVNGKNNAGSDIYDSIYVKMRRSPNVELTHETFKLVYPNGTTAGMRGEGHFTVTYDANITGIQTFTISAICSSDATISAVPIVRQMKKVKITRTLIH